MTSLRPSLDSSEKEGSDLKKVIAIDGPAASGKSTAARYVAESLNFVHVNSRLVFRAITWWAIREGLDEVTEIFSDALRDLKIDLQRSAGGLTVVVEGVSPGRALHGPAVTDYVPAISSVPKVRSVVLDRLRNAAARFDLVCDGRDIGTTVFAGADLKVYLIADVSERARRRILEGKRRVTEEIVTQEEARLAARDLADTSRTHSPLRKAEDAIEVDTTRMSLEEVVNVILSLARERNLG